MCPSELVLDDAAEQRARHDRHHGDADVSQEALHARPGLSVRSPARGAVGDDRPRELAEGDEQAEPHEHGGTVQLHHGNGRADEEQCDHRRARDEGSVHVVPRVARLLRELVHRRADEREAQAADRRAQERDAVSGAHLTERERLGDGLRRDQQRERRGNCDEPRPRDAAVVGLAERDQPVVERLAATGGGAGPCPPTSRSSATGK